MWMLLEQTHDDWWHMCSSCPLPACLFTHAPMTNNLVFTLIQSEQWTKEKYMLTLIVQEQGISPVLMDWLLDLNLGTTVLLLEKIQCCFSWTACINH